MLRFATSPPSITDSPELIIFRLAKGQEYFWTMQDNFKPKEKIRFG